MKVFKFGGASVRNPQAVRNVVSILQLFEGQQLVVVISAMGKTTNALEEIVKSLCERRKLDFEKQVQDLNEFHLDIMVELFPERTHKIYDDVAEIIEELEQKYDEQIPDNFDFEYDQIVSLGEVISTKIVNAFVREQGLSSHWADARKLIRTNHTYREAEIDWNRTQELITARFVPNFEHSTIQITQGFVGHTAEAMTTTLGREGSDFTAGIFAYCLDAENVTIWKDVPGMLNADPKWFDNTIKLDQISFTEAIELSYYGASVIHPKTVKPLQNKNIPLFVKSFVDPHAEGTIIQASTETDHLVPSFIFKIEQTLFSFKTKDFSFIVESHLSDIFSRLSAIGAKINLMQNSALSFSFLVDQSKINPEKVVETFSDDYDVRFNENLELVTIRHYDEATVERVMVDKEMILEQKSRHTARIVMKNK